MEDARYRLELGSGFLNEARDDVALRRWRSCVDNSQLAVENGAKSVLALVGPVGRTHATADLLRRALREARFPSTRADLVSQLTQLTEELGWDVHVASDYGDEAGRRTPWELFDEVAARQALGVAEEAIAVARQIVEGDLDP